MYCIEDADHNIVPDGSGKTELRDIKRVHRPDGGWSSNLNPDDQLHDENGNVYFVREIVRRTEGIGPHVAATSPVQYNSGLGQFEVVRTMREHTAEESQAIEKTQTESSIRDVSGRQAMWVLVELVSKLLAQGTIQATDFSPNVKDAYLSLKSKVNSVK